MVCPWSFSIILFFIICKHSPIYSHLYIGHFGVILHIYIAYLYNRGDWKASDISGEKLTHINYCFADIREGIVCGGGPDKLNEVKELKSRFPHLKVLISIGGWAAEGFSDAALTQESRYLFAQSAVAYMKSHGFDGIDLDWEYPCSSEGGIKSRPEDRENFNLMLMELRRQLDIQGENDSANYLLTAATREYPESLKQKAEFIKSRGLGGVMFWEYSQDYNGVLLETLYSALK